MKPRKRAELKKEEAASYVTLAKISKVCPGPRCGRNIEKHGGCDHMTCKWHCSATLPHRSLTIVYLQANGVALSSAGLVWLSIPTLDVKETPLTARIVLIIPLGFQTTYP